MQQDPPTPSDSKTQARDLVRTGGILLVAAVVLLSFSGAAAPAVELPATEWVDADPDQGETRPAIPTVTPRDPAPEPAEPSQTTTTDRLSFTTGDRLSDEQREEYRAYITALKAKGLHKGPAFYSSW